MNKFRWLWSSGYVPGLGEVESGKEYDIADPVLADALLKEGKIKPLIEKKPQTVKDKGGE